ncbi:MAG: hypothetical protein ACON4Z_01195 [Planctomycetota bacterium]
MMLQSVRSVTTIAALTASLATSLAAQGMLPYLPKKTMMAMSVPDLAASMAEFQKMPLARMWAEEEVQAFVSDVMEMATEQMDEGMDQMRAMHDAGMMPISPDTLMNLRLEGVTLAVTGVELNMSDFGPMPKVGTLVHLDFGESAATWNQLIQMGMGMLRQEAGDDLSMTEWTIGDVKAVTLTPTEAPPGFGMSINVAMVPGGVVLGTITDEVKDVVTNWVNKTPMLSQTAGYAASTKRIDTAGAEVQMFMAPDLAMSTGMDIMKMMSGMGGAIPTEGGMVPMSMLDFEGVERAMQAMGMRDMGTLGMSMSYADGKAVTKAYHARAKERTTTAAPASVDTKFLRWVPKDAVSFGAGTVDATSIYDMLIKGMQAYDPNMSEMMLAQLGQMETQLGFSIRKDLLGSIGDHYITWSMPMGTISAAPEMAVLVKVNSEEKLVGALKTIAAMSDGALELEEATKRGLKSYQLVINADSMDPGGMMMMNPFDMFQPTFAFKDGYMVMGFSASDVKRVFKRMDRDDNPKGDIRSNKEFMAIADQIPEGVSSLAFVDWKANFESMYQMATGVLAFVPMPEDVPVDMSMIPDSETLTQHLFAGLTYTKSNADGGVTVSISPFGPETFLALGAIVGGAAGASITLRDSGF